PRSPTFNSRQLVASATRTAAVPASSASATVATTASPGAAPAAVTAPAAAFGFRTGLVDGQASAVYFLAVQRRNRRLGLLVGLHLDEAEPLGAAGVAVHDDLRGLHGAVCLEQLFQGAVRNPVGQVAHVQLLAHVGSPQKKNRAPR